MCLCRREGRSLELRKHGSGLRWNYEFTEHSFAGITDPGIKGFTECSCIAAEIRIYGKTELRKQASLELRIYGIRD
jgi:hypothetical protein